MNSLTSVTAPARHRLADAERWPTYAAVVLGLVAVWAAARLTWAVVAPVAMPSALATTAAPPPVATDEAAATLAALRAARPFGTAAPEPADADGAPETRLDLNLRGVIAAGDARLARAFIAQGGGEERSYAVGAALPGGARLHAVHPDRVILERDARLETLSLPRETLPVLGAATGESSAVSGAEMRAVAEGNPQRLLDVVRPVAATDSNTGRMLGYRVYPGRDADRFSRLGLMPGDLITSVNGNSLDDPARGLEILRSMTAAESVMLNVERDGQTRLIQLPVGR